MSTSMMSDHDLERRLRTTLRTVAATVEDRQAARRRSRRRLLVGFSALAVAVPVTAAALLRFGPEYVDELPPDHPIVAGTTSAGRYWLVEMDRDAGCPAPPPGVELVTESRNTVGREWDTVGIMYGEPVDQGCAADSSAAQRDPAQLFSSGVLSGDTFLVLVAVHPIVSEVDVTVQGSTSRVPVHEVDGAGYTVLEVPAGATYTLQPLAGDGPVAGARQTRRAPTG